MSSESAIKLRKQLKIKTGSLNRLAKDHKLYEQEVEDQKRKLDKFIEENAEEWDIKNARKMLDESQRMVSGGQTLLAKVIGDLKELVAAAADEPEIKDDDADVIAAKDVLASVGASSD